MTSDWIDISGETSAVRLNNAALRVEDVLRCWHRCGWLSSMLQKAALEEIIRIQSQAFGFSATDDQLQQAADQFRRRTGLSSAEQTRTWLKAGHLSESDFEEFILQAMRQQFVFSRVTQAAERYFQLTASLWDRVIYREITVASESLAQELRCQCIEEGTLFADLVVQQCAGRPAGAEVTSRRCFRGLLPNWASSSLSTAVSGSLVGPIACPSGWALILVESLIPAVFDVETERAIRQDLFQRWLSARLREAKISFPLLDLLSCQNDS